MRACARLIERFPVTASEARQSITAGLKDGWPRFARHDEAEDGRTALAMTADSGSWTAAA
jgi:hypothetical protein